MGKTFLERNSGYGASESQYLHLIFAVKRGLFYNKSKYEAKFLAKLRNTRIMLNIFIIRVQSFIWENVKLAEIEAFFFIWSIKRMQASFNSDYAVMNYCYIATQTNQFKF